jgi:bifunctional enzyme Fae/Hps
MLDHRTRYLQIAFNYDISLVRKILPAIPYNERVIIEAGTPYIKKEGMDGVHAIRRLWKGHIVADLKTLDGAYSEVNMARQAGATAVTTLGSAPVETLDIFIAACKNLGIDSMVDMLGVSDPLNVVMALKSQPSVTILHRGRDEESTRGKVIQYRHVNRLRSKYDTIISAAGGVDLKEARSAIFNGASIVVVNLVQPGDPWQGISTDSDVGAIARQFLETIE